MRILLVTTEDPCDIYGGMGTFVYEFSTELKKKHDVKILYLDINFDKNNANSKLVDFYIPLKSTTLSKNPIFHHYESTLTASNEINERIQGFNPDIIHCNDRLSILPFMGRKNIVFSLHLFYADLFGMKYMDEELYHAMTLDRLAAENATAYIVYSDYYKRIVSERLSDKVNPIKLSLGFNSKDFYSNKDKTKIIVSFFGRLVNFQKGIDEYINAVEFFSDEWIKKHNVEFRIYGKPKNEKQFLRKNIHSVVFVTGTEKFKAYAETDIVVMPSKYEPLGLVGLEALASNCLLLAPVGLGMDEYFKPGINGIEILSEAESIYYNLKNCIENWNSFEKFQSLARASINSLTWENSIQQHEDLYQDVLNGRIKNRNAINSYKARKLVSWKKLDSNLKGDFWHNYFSFINLKKSDTVFLVSNDLYEFEYFSKIAQITPHSNFPEYVGNFIEKFNIAICLGEIEFSIDPILSLQELLRVSTKLVLGIRFGRIRINQTTLFENSSIFLKWVSEYFVEITVRIIENTDTFALFHLSHS